MSYLSLSDEADIARCESCEGDFHRDNGVEPECCGGWYCKKCWKLHRCQELVDSTGQLVRIGDLLHYIDDKRVFKISEIMPTYTKAQYCIGEKVLKTKTDGGRHTMRVRLMEHVD